MHLPVCGEKGAKGALLRHSAELNVFAIKVQSVVTTGDTQAMSVRP